jgi:hypothetical protein
MDLSVLLRAQDCEPKRKEEIMAKIEVWEDSSIISDSNSKSDDKSHCEEEKECSENRAPNSATPEGNAFPLLPGFILYLKEFILGPLKGYLNSVVFDPIQELDHFAHNQEEGLPLKPFSGRSETIQGVLDVL